MISWQGDINLSGITARTPTWGQTTGWWDPSSGLPATGPALEIPGSITLQGIPEPSTWALRMLGAACLFPFSKRTHKNTSAKSPISGHALSIMRKLISLGILLVSGLLTQNARADATIALNNIGADAPILRWNDLSLASGDIFVELLCRQDGSTWNPVVIASSSTTSWEISKPGYFDAGVGVVPGVRDGDSVDFQVRVWTGGTTYDTASSTGVSRVWTQNTGSWNPNSGLAPTGPTLAIPNPIIIGVPESSTLVLSIFGGSLWLTNKVLKAYKLNIK